ncbi:tetratricopeptide repeat protein [bacterium]|nr:tetratricopeptide repeat protein [bacterium]MBU1614046.1 tetratricopeptide repeat protein [bacterium]
MDYQQDLRQAIQLKKDRKLAEALPLFQGLQAQRPKDPYLLSNLGHLYFLMGDYRKALTFLEMAWQISPPSSFLINLKVDALLKLKRSQEAEEILKEQAKEADLAGVKKLVKLYLSQERFEEALAQTKSSLEGIGYERDLIISQAEALIKMNRQDEAAECFKKVIREDPEDEFAYTCLIKLRLKEKSAQEISLELKTLLSIPSRAGNAGLRTLLARAYKEAGLFEEALREYQAAVKLNPDNIFIRKQLGFCLSKMKDYEGVIPVMKECFIADPQDHYVTNTLFAAYRKTSRLNEALELVMETITRHPDQKKLWGLKKKLEKEIA